jgi:hypothetical protein
MHMFSVELHKNSSLMLMHKETADGPLAWIFNTDMHHDLGRQLGFCVSRSGRALARVFLFSVFPNKTLLTHGMIHEERRELLCTGDKDCHCLVGGQRCYAQTKGDAEREACVRIRTD